MSIMLGPTIGKFDYGKKTRSLALSTNVKDVIDMAVEYGVEHLGRTMAAPTVDAVRMALKRRYRAQLSTAAWRGYAN